MDRLDAWSIKSNNMDLVEGFYFDYRTEEIADYQDPGELLAALKQKEEEVILAAQLGNALLVENRQLKDQSDDIHQQYADKLEELEQGRHELQLKLEGCRSKWESQVGDLERDVRDLRAQVERLSRALGEAERDKRAAQLEHSELTQSLREQLHTAMEVEKAMSSELQALKQEVQQKGGPSRNQDEELVGAIREQVLHLQQKKQLQDEQLKSVCRENEELRTSLDTLNARLALKDGLNQQHSQQLAEAKRELEVARGRSQELQLQVEDLQEELFLQETRSHRNASLLSEMEISLQTAELEVSKEEMKQEMGSILQLLLPLTQELNSSEGTEVVDQQEGLQVMLHQLKAIAQTLAQASGPQKIHLEEENAVLRLKLQSVEEQHEVLQQAIRDRDEAIAKKNLMEAELVRSKNDMMSLNNQLLEAIQRKLELSQELEAWQDDIQTIISQQLRTQQQSELPPKKSTANRMAFFRRPSRTTSTVWAQQASSTAWSSDATQDKSQSPWRDWLRRGKGATYGK
ncbi:BICD family-like cargo adapter 1 isoform X2 [Antennarius striatus]|uniref:BICD family-like cargo adapter 1 isoform X2 n=1 Tax=Antennarius striatus TaxID=241820 RepID=UPI0035B00E22